MYKSFSDFKKIITKKRFSHSHTLYPIFNSYFYGLNAPCKYHPPVLFEGEGRDVSDKRKKTIYND